MQTNSFYEKCSTSQETKKKNYNIRFKLFLNTGVFTVMQRGCSSHFKNMAMQLPYIFIFQIMKHYVINPLVPSVLNI